MLYAVDQYRLDWSFGNFRFWQWKFVNMRSLFDPRGKSEQPMRCTLLGFWFKKWLKVLLLSLLSRLPLSCVPEYGRSAAAASLLPRQYILLLNLYHLSCHIITSDQVWSSPIAAKVRILLQMLPAILSPQPNTPLQSFQLPPAWLSNSPIAHLACFTSETAESWLTYDMILLRHAHVYCRPWFFIPLSEYLVKCPICSKIVWWDTELKFSFMNWWKINVVSMCKLLYQTEILGD